MWAQISAVSIEDSKRINTTIPKLNLWYIEILIHDDVTSTYFGPLESIRLNWPFIQWMQSGLKWKIIAIDNLGNYLLLINIWNIFFALAWLFKKIRNIELVLILYFSAPQYAVCFFQRMKGRVALWRTPNSSSIVVNTLH